MRKGLLLLVMLLMPSVCHSQTYTTGSGAIFTFTGTAPSAPCALTRGNQLAINSEAAGSFTQPTFTGSALAGHTHTVTPTGTVSTPTFSGTPATIQVPYIKVIFCSKN